MSGSLRAEYPQCETIEHLLSDEANHVNALLDNVSLCASEFSRPPAAGNTTDGRDRLSRAFSGTLTAPRQTPSQD